MTYHFTLPESYFAIWSFIFSVSLLLTSCIVAIVLLFFRARAFRKLNLKGDNELPLKIKELTISVSNIQKIIGQVPLVIGVNDKAEAKMQNSYHGLYTYINNQNNKIDGIEQDIKTIQHLLAGTAVYLSDDNTIGNSIYKRQLKQISDFKELSEKVELLLTKDSLLKTIAERPEAEKVKKTGTMSGEIGTPESKEQNYIPLNQRRKRYEKK